MIQHINKAITPTVSIGMPVYNGAEFIREALDSLLWQTYTDFELIISDNASTDGTGNICEEYAKRDNRIIYILQSYNKGLIDNFNFVLNEARGRYFMWAACDDIWSEDWIEVLLGNAESDGRKLLFYGRTTAIDKTGAIYRKRRIYDLDGSAICRNMKFLWIGIGISANLMYGLFRTEYIRSIGGIARYGDIDTSLDRLMLYRIIQDGCISSDGSIVHYKRLGGYGSRTTNSSATEKVINDLFCPKFLRYLRSLFIVPQSLQARILLIASCFPLYIYSRIIAGLVYVRNFGIYLYRGGSAPY